MSKQRDWGYTLGGPIGKPGGANKLFFFYGHEYRPRTTGGAVTRYRVPTLLERAGDFSQSTNNNGAVINLIRDASTGLPCTAANTSGCFQADGVLGRIPQNRLYPLGLNILKLWPAPNTSGLNYNYEVVAPTDKRLTQQPTIRLDYQASQRLRLTGKYTGQLATVKPTPGSIPGFNDTLQKYPFIYQPSATVDWNVTPTMFVEGTYGFIQNQLGSPIISPAANRCNVGLCDFPLLFPEAGVVDPDLYNPQVLAAINSPMLVDNRILLPPSFSWGSLIANPPPNLIYPQFLNKNRTHNVSISATKLAGRHTFKGGLLLLQRVQGREPRPGHRLSVHRPDRVRQRRRTIRSTPASATPTRRWGSSPNFSQQSKYVEGNYVYYNAEWYLQDNWKASNRLTLDYGVRFTHQQPQHDALLQGSNFFPDQW